MWKSKEIHEIYTPLRDKTNKQKTPKNKKQKDVRDISLISMHYLNLDSNKQIF